MSTIALPAKDAIAHRAIALATRGLSKAFGSLAVARDIAINLPVGARYALIGPNGAGKTTLINLMTGMLAPNAGQIFLAGDDITTLGPQERVRRGLARTFQINTLFAGLNALEAVTLAVAERRGLAGRFWRSVGSYGEAIDEAYEILRKLKLGDSCYQVTRELPYGRQRLLEIALALATKPKVLLLDEPNTICTWCFASPRTSLFWSAARFSRKAHLRKSPPTPACAKFIWASANMDDDHG